ncbi:reverse transcriptase family protein [uncultured Duncaniella sp.]|uniref:reverse transcriptase family protein n=1 Tax=uncultured Duncaniella sp. TaxID=2768039 RepID=UPI00259CE3C8|nr:reverse transcriptase family protein [uncultured Duncaniella sp.]
MIKSKRHLLHVIKVDSNRLEYILAHLDEFYYSFDKPKFDKLTGKPKRDGVGNIKKRTINSSKDDLKSIQSRIYNFLRSNISLPKYFYGGVKGKNNILNARYHQGNKYIFTTDLKFFFPSISNKRVYTTLVKLDFSPNIARIITKLITRNGQVPQGIPTSTLIANLVFRPTGEQILEMASRHHITQRGEKGYN